MMDLINPKYLVNAIIFTFIGFFFQLLLFYIYDKLTPWKLWREIIDNQNIALAIVAGAMALGISNIIAASISG
jgi:putative membrane protein